MHFVPVAEPKPSDTSRNVPFITAPPAAIMEGDADESNRNTPWIAGMTEEEGLGVGGGMVSAMEPLVRELDEKWNEIAPKALFDIAKFLLPEDRPVVASKMKEFYFKGKPVSYDTRKSLYNIYSDIFGNYILKMAAEMAVSKGEQVYLYQYSFKGKRSLLETFFKMPNVDQRKWTIKENLR